MLRRLSHLTATTFHFFVGRRKSWWGKAMMLAVYVLLYPLLVLAMIWTRKHDEKEKQSPVSEFIYPMF